MRKYVLLFLILLGSIHASPFPRERYFSLEGQNIRLKNFGFRLAGVTNATTKTRMIGFVETNGTYSRIPALFVSDIDKEISAFIHRNLTPPSGEQDLIVRVNELSVYETHLEYRDKIVANVRLTFIFRKDFRYFEKLTVSRHVSEIVKKDAAKKVPEVIARTIAECFDAFYQQHLDGQLQNVEITKADLLKKSPGYKELREEYLNLDRSEKGIYNTFYDFQQGTPDLQTDFNIEYKTKSTKDDKVLIRYALITDAKTGDPIDDVWGFTDGKQVFTLIGKSYVPLLKDEEGYYLRINAVNQEAKRASGMLVGIYGFLGGLVTAAVIASSASYQLLRIDIVTGKVVILDGPDNAGPVKEDEKVIRFFSSSYNSRDSELYLIINGEKQCALKRETWYKYKTVNPGDSVRLTVISANGYQTSETIVKKPGREDIYLIVDKKKKAPAIKEVYAQQIKGIESLMTPENRIYKDSDEDGERKEQIH